MSTTNLKTISFRSIIGILAMAVIVESTYHVEREPTCDCVCKDSFMDAAYAHKPLCHVISRFEKELLTVKQEIERRTVFINDILELKEIMEEQEDLIKTLEKQVEKLSRTRNVNEALPTPAALVMKEDFMQGDSNKDHRMKDEKELVDNVSTLMTKVEEFENLTSRVQEELISERRVRRHLEEDLNETRFSIKMLDDKLLNVTMPMDSRVTHVEEIVLSTLENMNKTLFEDHLKTLYYKVDGVVYKNETDKLDERLDQVETELLDTTNVNLTLKFAEELHNLTGILSTMNQTIMEKLAEEEYRLGNLENKTAKLDTLAEFQDQLENLENKTMKLDELEELQDQIVKVLNKTTKLDELESLQEQMAILINVTELMQTRALDMWVDLQNVRNTTSQLEKEIYEQSSKTNKSVESLQQDVSMKLQTINVGLSSLKKEVIADHASLMNLEADLRVLSADVAISESKVLNLSMATEKMMKEISTKIENLTGVWDSSLAVLAGQIEQWKNSKSDDGASSNYITQSKNTDDMDEWTGIDDNDNEVDLMKLKDPSEQQLCDLPVKKDEHLLITLETDDRGGQRLVFGCRPIGRYALKEGPVSLHCKDGSWDRDLPTCTRLKNESEIIAIGKELATSQNPCHSERGDVPDVTDCSYFFKCDNGISYGRLSCPPGLLFDERERRCEWPATVQCADASRTAEKLADLIPTILIEPDIVDKPFGLIATNESGYLIVYPNTNFKLHCLFPENQVRSPTWESEQFSVGTPSPLYSKNIKHRSTVEFRSISSIYSGIYTCITPYNKKHSIRIAVEAVKCPAFQVDSEREKALIYNRHPDGEERILSTTAKFICEGTSPITAMCLSNGTWSRPAPTEEECPLKSAKIWGCDVYIKHTEKDPDVSYNYNKHEIHFDCPRSRINGPSHATCINGTWMPSKFPKCF